eukprot:gene17335-19756_t
MNSALLSVIFLAFITSSRSQCLSGWNEFQGYCYNLNLGDLDPNDCMATCSGLGATFPCIQNQAQNDYLMSTIPAGTSGHSSLGKTVFVGMTDVNLTGTWDRPSGCVTSYTNWQSGRPSATKTNQKFVVMQQDGQWIDSDATGLDTQCTCQYALPPPTRNPSSKPTMNPTKVPTTMQPTKVPTIAPSRDPTRRPTAIPSVYDAEAPLVAIASDNSVTSLNTEVKVTYTGTVTAKEPCFAIWTVDSVAPTLESVVTTVTRSTASVTFESIAGVLASVDAVAFASANAVPVGENVLETVSLFADLVTSQRVSGESSVEYIYDSFRSASVRQFASPSAGLKVSTPQTFAEQSANIPAAS